MPPGPAFNWLCVLASTADVLSNAARIRASQATGVNLRSAVRRNTYDVEQPPIIPNSFKSSLAGETKNTELPPATSARPVQSLDVERTVVGEHAMTHIGVESESSSDRRNPEDPTIFTRVSENIEKASYHNIQPESNFVDVSSPASQVSFIEPLADPPTPSEELAFELSPQTDTVVELVPSTRTLSSSKVPSSRIGRLFHYGGLAASLGYGAASELVRRSRSNETSEASLVLTEANIKRLVSKLIQMRGAALKLGQFLSIQDTHILPPEIDQIFRRVQDSAHYMPDWQMEGVMQGALGASWTSYFESFERVPFAAASIGQVHRATLKAEHSPTGEQLHVAVKIQFPDIANSIASDLGYIKLLLTAGKLLPKGLFLDRTVEVMKGELADECDYTREAGFAKAFRENLKDNQSFKVPWVWDQSTERVLVMEHITGVSVGEAGVKALSQSDRNDIASRVIELCLKELFEFRMMQTDPNWTNFLWNSRERKIGLVDFGATREYSTVFLDGWLGLLQAAASDDFEACVEWSLRVGYLTGGESQEMTEAHVKSMTLLATPFKALTPMPFSFGPKTVWADITGEIRAQIPVMLQHRLTPPPKETYSLNRKLSGAFLLAARLEATVDTRRLWESVVSGYRGSDEA